MTSPVPRRGEAATELREAIARAIRGAMIPGTMVGPDDDDYAAADAVLALPEVAELRASAKAEALLEAADVLDQGRSTKGIASRVLDPGVYMAVAFLRDRAALASSSATEPESAS